MPNNDMPKEYFYEYKLNGEKIVEEEWYDYEEYHDFSHPDDGVYHSYTRELTLLEAKELAVKNEGLKKFLLKEGLV